MSRSPSPPHAPRMSRSPSPPPSPLPPLPPLPPCPAPPPHLARYPIGCACGLRFDDWATVTLRVPDPSAEQMRRLVRQMGSRRALLAAWHSQRKLEGFARHSIWGFLLQINATSNCLHAIEAHERRSRFQYTWVARSRIDARWFGRLPMSAWQAAIADDRVALVPSADFAFNIGPGRGINDRFVMGSRTVFSAYARLYDDLVDGRGVWHASTLPRPLNGEYALALQLEHNNVGVNHSELLPFCLVGRAASGLPFDRGETGCAECRKKGEGLKALRGLPPREDGVGIDREGCIAPCANRPWDVFRSLWDVFRSTWDVFRSSAERERRTAPPLLTYSGMREALQVCAPPDAVGRDAGRVLAQWRTRRDAWGAVLPLAQPSLGRCAVVGDWRHADAPRASVDSHDTILATEQAGWGGCSDGADAGGEHRLRQYVLLTRGAVLPERAQAVKARRNASATTCLTSAVLVYDLNSPGDYDRLLAVHTGRLLRLPPSRQPPPLHILNPQLDAAQHLHTVSERHASSSSRTARLLALAHGVCSSVSLVKSGALS